MTVTLQLDDIQGIIARGFSRHRSCRYVILSVHDAAAAAPMDGVRARDLSGRAGY